MDTENNTAVPHDEFIVGFERGTIGFHFIGEPSELLAVPQKKKFAVFVILHTLVPFILIPLWAYHERNWWLKLSQMGMDAYKAEKEAELAPKIDAIVAEARARQQSKEKQNE